MNCNIRKSGYLEYAFKKAIVSVFNKFKVSSMLLLLVGASVWDALPVLGSLVIGVGIGVFIATLFNEAGVRAMFVSARARRNASGSLLIEKEGVQLLIDDNKNTVNCLDAEKNSFWFTTGYLFCFVSDDKAEPKIPSEPMQGP